MTEQKPKLIYKFEERWEDFIKDLLIHKIEDSIRIVTRKFLYGKITDSVILRLSKEEAIKMAKAILKAFEEND